MPTAIQPLWVLVIVNAILFFYGFGFEYDLTPYLGLYLPENPNFAPWQILTHMFMHGGLGHFVFNMVGLISFGMVIQQTFGPWRFLAFYFICGLGAALLYSGINLYHFQQIQSQIVALGYPQEIIDFLLQSGRVSPTLLDQLGEERLQEFYGLYHAPVVGASGAIYGIMAAFGILYPKAKMMFLLLPFPIKAMFLIPVILLVDVFFGITRYSLGNVAHFAHIGGAVTGALICLVVLWRLHHRAPQ